jgi:hypothetical protein
VVRAPVSALPAARSFTSGETEFGPLESQHCMVGVSWSRGRRWVSVGATEVRLPSVMSEKCILRPPASAPVGDVRVLDA